MHMHGHILHEVYRIGAPGSMWRACYQQHIYRTIQLGRFRSLRHLLDFICCLEFYPHVFFILLLLE